jgi:hypothetical protein
MQRIWPSCSSAIVARLAVAAVWLSLAAPYGFTQGSKIEASPGEARIQKISPRSSSKPYFIEFRARSAATYGHMYVIYGKVNANNQIVVSDIAGLHPAGDRNDCENCSVLSWTLGHLVPVPAETGASDGDLEEKYVSSRYRVMLDAATFKKVADYINKLKRDTPVWNALWRNCVSFGNDIARNAGLETPSFPWMEPQAYVDSLRQLNGGAPQGPLRFAASRAVKPLER